MASHDRYFQGVCWTALAVGTSAAAHAQLPLSRPTAEAAVEPGDILVTARKRGERLQSVPVTVSAITGDTLEKNGIRDVKDVLMRVPGISYGGVDRGLSNYNIRGIGTTANSPTVGIYLDDIALNTIATGFTGAFDPVFFDMERLEVLKGPQGTLYGGSAMGGAIKYVSRRPALDHVTVDAAAGVGSTDSGGGSYNAEAVLNLPVSATVAVRGGFYYRHNGGFIDNVAGGAAGGALVNRRFSTVNPPGYAPTTHDTLSTYDDQNYNSDRTVAGRFSLLFQPDPSWTILGSAFYQDYRQANPGIYFPNLSGLTSSYRLAGHTSDKDGVYSLSIEKDLGGVKFTSLSAYYSREIAFDRDYSFFIGSLIRPLYPLNSFNQSTSSTDTYSQEVRLASDNVSDARFSWIVGVFASRQNDRLIQIVTTPGGEASLGGTATGYFGNIRTVTKQYSAFGEITYSPFDRFKIILGGRYFDIGIDVDSVGSGLLNGGNTSVVSASKERGFNPKALLSFQAAQDNLLYASATKGFRPGGPNRNNISSTVCGADLARLGLTSAPSGFGSDNLWTYEIGVKNQFADRKITANASAYYTDWKDIQQTVLLPGCGFSFTGNIGKARVKGGEIELSATPFTGVTIGGNVSYTDSQIQETAVGVSGQVGDGILGVPKWTASAFSSVTFPMGDVWQGTFLLNYQYQGGARRQFERTQLTIYPNAVRGQIANLAEFREAYDVVNTQLSFQKGDLTIRTYINNLFNVHPAYDVRVDLGAVTYGTIRPRTVGLETRVRF